MRYRIVKHADNDYHVERKVWFGLSWELMHSTPGFPTEQKATDYIRRFTNPEVVAYFDDDGKPSVV